MKLNEEELEKMLVKYPLMEVLLQAGTISNRIVREVLDIDKWLMQELQTYMLLNGIALGVSSTTFKATEETVAYLKGRKLCE